MAYDEAFKKKEDCIVGESGIEEVGLAAGRSQREKKRSYKDLLREEEEIDAEVRKSAKKKAKDIEGFLLAADIHKKKKKLHHLMGEEFYYGELSPMEPVKKKKKSEGHQVDTAMGLLKAITSPISTVSKPSKKPEKSLSAFSSASYPPLYSEIRKEHKKKASSAEHEETPEEGDFHKAKKMKPIFVNTDTVTVREAEGLKMKLLLSPKDKSGTDDEAFNFATSSSLKKSSKKMSREQDHATFHSAIEAQSLPKTVVRKKHKSESRASESFDSETRFYSEVRAGNLSECDLSGLDALDTASSSGGELEAGELVIDDSFREMKKKKKKDKKSKKKKDKEKHREKKHSKSKKMHAHSPAKILATTKCCFPTQSAVSTPYAINVPPPSIFHVEGQSEKKKKKEEKDKEKVEKPEKKKKNMSAYQLFCKEYRINIVAEHPGIDFGELSKKLAEVWKQLPDKEKQVWKQKCQYLQHKQNKAEAMTVKRKLTDLLEETATKQKGRQNSSSLSSMATSHKKSSHLLGLGGSSHSSSPIKMPEVDPIDVAAHLQLLGESLSLIGHRLQETEGMVAVSGSLSVLLDSIICALGPLTCLTAQVDCLNGCPKEVLAHTLDNIAYIMPGL
ncbi:HMG domain-containing protein 4a isoform X1 [Stegostoma tigrinum]|uniref:HMG domain-containing protein 4a isoform X1 n=3 Tax=Stegostoma tigrinum TaxID=3053191 RepID=UPI00202B7D44|nr:HMG domain-containing protein 4a isoform X1 [Stegostoma tigrinum]XP_048377091.1 HMG domain-containing protein 4a isoform X1 [Stegostoma tigrinum]XP_048377092.1 HMG domain-containing protein 4a isoform X1 [Stegostoma tigrinum]